MNSYRDRQTAIAEFASAFPNSFRLLHQSLATRLTESANKSRANSASQFNKQLLIATLADIDKFESKSELLDKAVRYIEDNPLIESLAEQLSDPEQFKQTLSSLFESFVNPHLRKLNKSASKSIKRQIQRQLAETFYLVGIREKDRLKLLAESASEFVIPEFREHYKPTHLSETFILSFGTSIINIIIELVVMNKHFYLDRIQAVIDIMGFTSFLLLSFVATRMSQYVNNLAGVVGLAASLSAISFALQLTVILMLLHSHRKGYVNVHTIKLTKEGDIRAERYSSRQLKQKTKLVEFLQSLVSTIIDLILIIAGRGKLMKAFVRVLYPILKIVGPVVYSPVTQADVKFKLGIIDRITKTKDPSSYLNNIAVQVSAFKAFFDLIGTYMVFEFGVWLAKRYDIDLQPLRKIRNEIVIQTTIANLILAFILLILIHLDLREIRELQLLSNQQKVLDAISEAATTSEIARSIESESLLIKAKEKLAQYREKLFTVAKTLLKKAKLAIRRFWSIIPTRFKFLLFTSAIQPLIHYYCDPEDSNSERECQLKTIELSKEQLYSFVEKLNLKVNPEKVALLYDLSRKFVINKKSLKYKSLKEFYAKLSEGKIDLKNLTDDERVYGLLILFTPLPVLAEIIAQKHNITESRAEEYLIGSFIAAIVKQAQKLFNTKYAPAIGWNSKVSPNAFSFGKLVAFLGGFGVAGWGPISAWDLISIMAHELGHNYLQTRRQLIQILSELFALFITIIPISIYSMILGEVGRLPLTTTALTLYIGISKDVVARVQEIEADTVATYLTAATAADLLFLLASVRDGEIEDIPVNDDNTEHSAVIAYKLGDGTEIRYTGTTTDKQASFILHKEQSELNQVNIGIVSRAVTADTIASYLFGKFESHDTERNRIIGSVDLIKELQKSQSDFVQSRFEKLAEITLSVLQSIKPMDVRFGKDGQYEAIKLLLTAI